MTYRDTGLVNGQSYTYQVTAISEFWQEGVKSDPVSRIPTASSPPAPPSPPPSPPAPPSGPPSTNEEPNANAGGDEKGNYYGVVNEEIMFDGSASNDSDGTIELYEWDFDGDNNFKDGTGKNPTHTWLIPGEYTVKLRVTDNDGLSGEHEVKVIISQFNHPPSNPKVNGPNKGTINLLI